eukprot:5577327-Amphidinium_carterae.1
MTLASKRSYPQKSSNVSQRNLNRRKQPEKTMGFNIGDELTCLQIRPCFRSKAQMVEAIQVALSTPLYTTSTSHLQLTGDKLHQVGYRPNCLVLSWKAFCFGPSSWYSYRTKIRRQRVIR